MDTAQFTLRGVVIPEHLPFRRDSPVPERYRDDYFHTQHDSHTLAYDAVRLSNGTDVLITCPELENFWPLLRDGLRVNGVPARGLKRQLVGQCEHVRLRAPNGSALSVRLDDWEAELPVRASESDAFRGRKVIATLSRNNDLEWISAWARYHARAHGADAVVLYDNNSDSYGLNEVADALDSVKELSVVRVIGTPYLFGDGVNAGGKAYWMYPLQNSILNITRLDMGAASEAVLNCDIDELVISKTGSSVFDAARSALRRGVKIRGSYVFPDIPDPIPMPQYEHIRRADPNRACQNKWCARPAGLFSRVDGWTNYHEYGGDWMRRLIGRPRPHPDFELAHCVRTSTGWYPERFSIEFPKALARDPELERAMALARP